jgi:hypothetical protein
VAEPACNCSHVPPTMPVYRDEHLIDCPVRAWAEVRDPEQMRAAFDEIADLVERHGKQEGFAEFLKRRAPERAHASAMRAAARLAAPGDQHLSDQQGGDA